MAETLATGDSSKESCIRESVRVFSKPLTEQRQTGKLKPWWGAVESLSKGDPAFGQPPDSAAFRPTDERTVAAVRRRSNGPSLMVFCRHQQGVTS